MMIFDAWNIPWHGLIAAALGGLAVYVIAKVYGYIWYRRQLKKIMAARERLSNLTGYNEWVAEIDDALRKRRKERG